MFGTEPRSPRPLWPGFLIGVVAGALATTLAALTNPGLYIDWGSVAGTLLVVPIFTIGAASLVTVPLALRRRIGWGAVPIALVTSVVIGELMFQASLGTEFARRSAAKHWAGVEQRAAAEREATERETCRRLLALPGAPPPRAPAPDGGVIQPAPDQATGSTRSLVPFDRERCATLIGR